MSRFAAVCLTANKLRLRTNLMEILTAAISTTTIKIIKVMMMIITIMIIIQ